MNIISYNVNGIRSALRKGLGAWLNEIQADIVCLQEIKALPEQIDPVLFEHIGYQCFWMPAEKKGYSGVGILTRKTPEKIVYGAAIPLAKEEGRLLQIDFPNVSILSVYMPSGTSGEHRQSLKMEWLHNFSQYIENMQPQNNPLVVAGDFNICHKAIDIHDPIRNKHSSGFLPEERAWMDQWLEKGFIDTFRHFCQDPHCYSWWSFRAQARSKNLGWRIDYQMASQCLKNRLQKAAILPEVTFSDHCPTLLKIQA